MRTQYKEARLKVSEMYLDEGNPRFPPVSSQREAIQTMLKDQGEKILVLATDIFENGLNPSSRMIVFRERNRYTDGDGNRRLTALKILETPSLCDSEPRLRKKVDALLRRNGTAPAEVDCVIFKSRENAKHWISVNHSGLQDGKGQIPWDAEQKNRFEGKYTIGLQALDVLMYEKLIDSQDKLRIKKSTLDRVLEYSAVKSKLSIVKRGDNYSFNDIDSLARVTLALRDKRVDLVYTSEKGIAFINSVLARGTHDGDESSFGGTYDPANESSPESNSGGKNSSGSGTGVDRSDEEGSAGGERASEQNPNRSKRKKGAGLAAFGGALSLKPGHINNIYRDIEALYEAYRSKKVTLSDDFIVIFRMSLRMLAETAAQEIRKELKSYLTENYDRAKSTLDQNQKTSLSNQGVDKGKIIQLLQTGAHNYHNSRNEEQAVALSVILGAILSITHGKKP